MTGCFDLFLEAAQATGTAAGRRVSAAPGELAGWLLPRGVVTFETGSDVGADELRAINVIWPVRAISNIWTAAEDGRRRRIQEPSACAGGAALLRRQAPSRFLKLGCDAMLLPCSPRASSTPRLPIGQAPNV